MSNYLVKQPIIFISIQVKKKAICLYLNGKLFFSQLYFRKKYSNFWMTKKDLTFVYVYYYAIKFGFYDLPSKFYIIPKFNNNK